VQIVAIPTPSDDYDGEVATSGASSLASGSNNDAPFQHTITTLTPITTTSSPPPRIPTPPILAKDENDKNVKPNSSEIVVDKPYVNPVLLKKNFKTTFDPDLDPRYTGKKHGLKPTHRYDGQGVS